MVGIYTFLWARYTDYAKKYQLQVDAVTDFNSKIAEIQIELANVLFPHYQGSEQVRSLCEPWIRNIAATSNGTGVISRPTSYYRILSIGITDGSGNLLYDANPILENELPVTMRIPQRKPDLTNNRVYYLASNNQVQLFPKSAIPYLMYYLIYPTAAVLAFTQSVVNGEYVQTFDPTNTIDLAWDADASNILLYMLLEKYGISSRDELLVEFGKLGIQSNLMTFKNE